MIRMVGGTKFQGALVIAAGNLCLDDAFVIVLCRV